MSNRKVKTYRDIQGWFDFEYLYMDLVARLFSPIHETRVLEVGTWLGKSTCFMAGLAKAIAKPVKIFAVDTFKGEASCDFQKKVVKKSGGSILKKFKRNIKQLGLEDYIVPIESESHSCLDKLPKESFHVIFIDADHSYEAIKRDLNYLWPALKDTGLFCGHDYDKDVKKAVDEFAQEQGLDVYQEQACWVIFKKDLNESPKI